ncbi:MAG: hypothetical protein QXN23_06000 [Candidatus Caldarchaeum sp.]
MSLVPGYTVYVKDPKDENKLLERPLLLSLTRRKFIKAIWGDNRLEARLYPAKYLLFAGDWQGTTICITFVMPSDFPQKGSSIWVESGEGRSWAFWRLKLTTEGAEETDLTSVPAPILYYMIFRWLNGLPTRESLSKLETVIFDEPEIDGVVNSVEAREERTITVSRETLMAYAELYGGRVWV